MTSSIIFVHSVKKLCSLCGKQTTKTTAMMMLRRQQQQQLLMHPMSYRLFSTNNMNNNHDNPTRRSFSMAVQQGQWHDDDVHNHHDDHHHHHHRHIDHKPTSKHCNTCTCDNINENEQHNITNNLITKTTTTTTTLPDKSNSTKKDYSFSIPQHEMDYGILPPPLPEPVYSVHKRVLPSQLVALSSATGRNYLLQSLQDQTAESYWSLTEQFMNQDDPAYCGVTTLTMALNAMNIDPNVRWKGGWRYYGNENVLLDHCCLSSERIRRIGVTLEEFRLLARCQGLSVDLKRPTLLLDKANDDSDIDNATTDTSPITTTTKEQEYTLEDFRNDIQSILTTSINNNMNAGRILVVSFSRAALGQTGDGHFSPIAAFHKESDSVLILDVARFKYSPYWVTVTNLYNSMKPLDEATNKPRGWFLLSPPLSYLNNNVGIQKEDRRPAELVPMVGEPDACPVGKIKVEFCKAKQR